MADHNIDEMREKFKTEIEEADWDMLKTHHDNGAVFVVDKKLPLIDVGIGIALDKTQMVKMWLDDNLLYRPNDSLVEVFERDKFKKCADFIIIQPYVLISLKTEFEAN